MRTTSLLVCQLLIQHEVALHLEVEAACAAEVEAVVGDVPLQDVGFIDEATSWLTRTGVRQICYITMVNMPNRCDDECSQASGFLGSSCLAIPVTNLAV